MNRIKELREKAKLSQRFLATKLNVSQATLSGWENNKWEPDSATLKLLAEIFNVSIDYLLGYDANKNDGIPITVPKELENVKFAFHGGFDGLAQEDLDDVAKYVEFLREKRKNK